LATKDAAKAARDNAEAAKDAVSNSKISARAVVLIDNVRFSSPHPEINSTILFTLKNFGPTIAYRVRFTGEISGPGGGPESTEPGTAKLAIAETPSNTIAPQGSVSWMSKSISAFLQPMPLRVQQIIGRTADLTYRLDVAYDDAFGEPHTYHCEGKYETALNGFIVTSSSDESIAVR